MGKPLTWKGGGGYDIHLLRDGPASKKLTDVIDLGDVQPSMVTFIPAYSGGTDFGVVIDPATGEIKAGPHPDPSQPKLTNFILSIVGVDPEGNRSELIIRIHVHDNLDLIWLTPASLTIHKEANECQFTVLAQFDEGVRGDITEWSQFTFKSLIPNTTPPQASPDVLVSASGVLTAVNSGKSASIVAELHLQKASDPNQTLVSLTSDPVTVFTKESWVDTAAAAEFNFIPAGLRPGRGDKDQPKKNGTVVPNKDDPNSDKRDSVKSVVENALNVLFIAEGFRQDQRGDFNDYIWKIVEHLRTDRVFQPFNLLKDSINYWSAFIPSEDAGITLSGDYYHISDIPNKMWSWLYGTAPMPRTPDPDATSWSVEEMVYEVGLGTPIGPDPMDLHSCVVDYWQKIYGDYVTEARVAASFQAWRTLSPVQLNERNSAFGIHNYDRPRASPGLAWVALGSDPRRTSDPHIFEFIGSLNYGKDPASGESYNVGATWKPGGKDAGLVCFICLSEKLGGINWGGYFLITTGISGVATVTVPKVARQGEDIEIPPVETMGRTVLASNVSHELSHSFGLGDEYGDGGGTYSDADHSEPNLQTKSIITSQKTLPGVTGPKIVYDKTNDIKWRWSRVTKAGALAATPGRSVSGFYVPLRKGHSKAFAVGDLVRFRQWPVHDKISGDPFVAFQQTNGFVFKVKLQDDNGVGFDIEDANGHVIDVSSPNPGNLDPRSWGDILLSLFKPGSGYSLISPLTIATASGNVELPLLSEVIRKQIAASNGPSNADPGNEATGYEKHECKPHGGAMTPTNLPTGFRFPPGLASRQDLVGIYEGGGGHDCGSFRPAGRCKMRDSDDSTIPFCSVCRYIIVDSVDPTKHAELDRIYTTQYPT